MPAITMKGLPEELMSILRFFMWLSLVVWIGGIIFFAFVVAPTVFRVLPTHQLAGNVVSRSLAMLHGIGITCGVVFLAASMINSAVVTGSAQPFAARHVLVCLMILLTLVSMFAVGARMEALKKDMVTIDDVPQDDERRVEFNQLHVWSTRLEGTVLLMGLAVIFLAARRMT
jgi:uncharacterized membrane protein